MALMLQHGDDTTSGNFLQIRPEKWLLSVPWSCSQATCSAHSCTLALSLAGPGPGEGGRAVTTPRLTSGHSIWVLGAGARGAMDSRVVHGDRPECGRRCEPGCSTQHVAPSTQHAARSTQHADEPQAFSEPGQPGKSCRSSHALGLRGCGVHPRSC